MIACIVGNLASVKSLVEEAKKKLSAEQLSNFVNIKVMKSMGGNNALLFACGYTNISDDGILDYLID